MTCLGDHWEVPGQLGGAPGSIKVIFEKLEDGDFDIFGRSKIDLRAPWDHIRASGDQFQNRNYHENR